MKKIVIAGFIILLFLTFFITLTGSLWSTDALWHLKTGEWIWEHKSIPDADPFSYTLSADEQRSKRVQFLLKQYWVAQVLFYLSTKLNGIASLIYLRAAILTLSLYFSFRLVRKKGLDSILSVLILMPSAYLAMKNFTAERPQLFSFLFSIMVLYLLEDLKKSSSSLNSFSSFKSHFNLFNLLKLFKLPLVMVIWANMHGGYVLGIVLIGLYIIAEGVKRVNRANETFVTSGTFLTFFIVCLISILITLINPNGWDAFEFAFQYKGISAKASEYRSPIMMDIESHTITWPYYLLVVFGFSAILRKGKKADLHDLLIFGFLAVISLISVRYMGFFIFLGPPVFASYLSNIRLSDNVKTVIALSISSLFLFFIYSLKHAIFKTDIAAHLYPARAVEYIAKKKPAGRLFNHQGWGGYIIWRLPEYRVFADTRYLSEINYEEYNIISIASYGWQEFIKGYGIGVIIIPGLHPISGQLSPLFSALMESEEWELAYVDETALVFLLRSLNSVILRTGALPKICGYDHILRQADYHLRQNPSNVNAMLAAAVAYNKKGMPDRAEVLFEKARALGLTSVAGAR